MTLTTAKRRGFRKLARIIHESATTTADMVVLPGVLGSRILRRIVQVRLGYEILRLPGNKPIFLALAALRSGPHAGSQSHGLATQIHELSGLEKQGAILVRKVLFSVISLVFLCTAQVVFAGPLKVFVSIVPQKYLVNKIGGDLVEINVMVQPGASPATYEPKPWQMVALAKTDMYLAIGVPFEATWLGKIAATNTDMLVVLTEVGIEKTLMKPHHRLEEGGQRHTEAAEHHHEEGEVEGHYRAIKDPHVWLSPPLVMIQARNIVQAFLAVDPDHRSVYEENYKSFINELVALDLELRAVFAGKGEDSEFMVFHPAWGYFAQAYGLQQVSVEIEGKEPKPAELQYLIQYAKKRGIKAVFVQPQFSHQAARAIAKAIGGQIVFADPLAPDWGNNLLQVASKFRTAIR